MMADRPRLVLGLILLFALVLRLPGLNGPLWFDEIVTVDTHLRLPWGQMLTDYSMNHHYLHNILAKLSISVFGEAPWAVRLPALLFGLASIAAMWQLARQVAGTGMAHLTALLLALSYHHIWFSQNARGYTGLALFSILAMTLWLRALDRPSLRLWVGYALCFAAAVFTHLTGVFFFAAQGLVLLFRVSVRAVLGRLGRGEIALPLAGYGLGVLVTTVLYLPVLTGIRTAVSAVSGTSAGDRMKEYQSPLWTAVEAVRTAIGSAGFLPALIALAILVLALIGAFRLRGSKAWFGVVVFAHIGLTVLLLMLVGMRIWPRFFFPDIGPLFLLILLGIAACGDWLAAALRRPALARTIFALAVGAMLAVSALLASRNYTAPKQDLAGAYALAVATSPPGTRIFAPGYAGEVFRSHFSADWPLVMTDADYRAAMATPGPATLVVAFPDRIMRDFPSLDRDRQSGALRLEKAFPGTLGDGYVLVFQRD